ALNHEKLDQGGYLSTYTFSSWVPDAAAGMSCIATGERANNGEIGLDALGTVRETLLEKARKAGKAVGIVSDSRITYASCAAFFAHSTNRYQESDFASSMIEFEPDLAFGGGLFNFLPKNLGGMREDGRDLIAEAQKKGYQILKNRMELIKCSTLSSRILGLFKESNLSYEIDRPADEPSIQLLVDKAIKLLNNKSPQGFVLVIVSDRIAQALRDHDVRALVSQYEALNEACGTLLAFTRLHPDTQFLYASAYSTNPPFISEKTELSWLPNIKASAEFMAAKIDTLGENVGWVMSRYAGIENLSEAEKSLIFHDLKNEYLPMAIGEVLSRRQGIFFQPPAVQKKLDLTLGNTAVVTPFFVHGAGAEKFDFFMANYQLGSLLNSFIGD
ncbi:MAG: alkaline phosphatase, partial [Candidatus Wallbacteria bacterium]|nr:alkaline phosphatase [Candidatus Wallbacteria bacterium]